EARALLSVPGGVRAIAAANGVDGVVIRAHVFPGADGVKGDAEKGKRRKESGVSAILYDTFPIRFWDHDLGPRWSRLLRLRNVSAEERPQPEDLTGDSVNSLEEAPVDLSPDGNTLVTTWRRDVGKGFRKTDLVAIEDG